MLLFAQAEFAQALTQLGRRGKLFDADSRTGLDIAQWAEFSAGTLAFQDAISLTCRFLSHWQQNRVMDPGWQGGIPAQLEPNPVASRPSRCFIRFMKTIPAALVLSFVLGVPSLAPKAACAAPLSAEQQKCISKANTFQRHGWTYIHLEGTAGEIGFQHGYLLAAKIAEGIHATRTIWEHDTAMPWTWAVERGAAMFVPHMGPEELAELEGMADGMNAAGQKTTRDELLAYNGSIELSDYWWPQVLKQIKDTGPIAVREGCSSFIATGSATKDGNVVLGHNTMMDYPGAFPNVIADIAPAKGHRILWQTQPGWIHSGTDFFITDAGLVGSETTIGSFDGFDTNGVPEFARMRRATQDAGSIDEWCDIMKRGNNGGYANAWLVGDINTREIARLELGLHEVALEKKKDGAFTGSNVAENNQLLRFETNARETDIRESSVARRVRWKQLMKQYAGRIDLELAEKFESDHFDTYRGKEFPGGRTLCGHFELDGDASQGWPGVPYGCAGTVDGKVVDATMAKNMSFAARWGSACGRSFDAARYLSAHPQFDWMQPLLKDRPSEPWTQFKIGESTSARLATR